MVLAGDQAQHAKPEVRSSRSLWDGGLPHPSDQNVPPRADGTRRSYVDGPEDQRLRLIERTVDLGEDGRYLIAVAGDSQEIEEETRSFDRVLVVTFGTLIVALLLTTMFQVRFGLCAAQAHFRRPGRDPERERRATGRAVPV